MLNFFYFHADLLAIGDFWNYSSNCNYSTCGMTLSEFNYGANSKSAPTQKNRGFANLFDALSHGACLTRVSLLGQVCILCKMVALLGWGGCCFTLKLVFLPSLEFRILEGLLLACYVICLFTFV